MKFLFFDIECANTTSNVCKMCSFGYVITDENFSITEKNDILMDPQNPFDYYFFKPGSKITLAYNPSEYKKQPPFDHKYEEILNVFNRVDVILGFDINIDIKYLKDSCTRYNLAIPELKGFDVREILKKHEITGKLHQIAERYLPPDSNTVQHKSDDDAMLTARLLEYICKTKGKSLLELVKISV